MEIERRCKESGEKVKDCQRTCNGFVLGVSVVLSCNHRKRAQPVSHLTVFAKGRETFATQASLRVAAFHCICRRGMS